MEIDDDLSRAKKLREGDVLMEDRDNNKSNIEAGLSE
jgi:hypothetical protein